MNPSLFWHTPAAQLESRTTENPSDGKPATTKETIKQRNKNTNIGTPTGVLPSGWKTGRSGKPDA